MRRGTTPTHTITTDLDLTEAAVIFLTYKQCKHVVCEFERDRLTVESDQIQVTLTQAETLAFDDRKDVDIQIRARFPDGSAVASNIMTITVTEILKDGVI